MTRIDHYRDPNAPAANTTRIDAAVAVVDELGRLLMVRRAQNGTWSLPGGAKEPDESLAEAAARETLAQTGLRVEATDVVGTYSDPQHRIEYPEDGLVAPQCAVLFAARILGGELAHDAQVGQVRFVERAEFAGLPMHQSQRMRVEDAFTHHADPSLLPHLG